MSYEFRRCHNGRDLILWSPRGYFCREMSTPLLGKVLSYRIKKKWRMYLPAFTMKSSEMEANNTNPIDPMGIIPIPPA